MLKSLLVLLTMLSTSSSFAAELWPDHKALPADLGKDDSGPKYLRLVFPESLTIPSEKSERNEIHMINGKIVSAKELEKASGYNQTVCWITSSRRLDGENPTWTQMDVGDIWYISNASFSSGKPGVKANSMATLRLHSNESVGFLRVQTNYNGLVRGNSKNFDQHMEVTLAKLRQCLGTNAILEVIER